MNKFESYFLNVFVPFFITIGLIWVCIAFGFIIYNFF